MAARKAHDLEDAGSNPVSAIRQSRFLPKSGFHLSHLIADREKRGTRSEKRYVMDIKALFIDKSKTLIVNTDLALIVGDLNCAIVLNQIEYWLRINEKAKNNFIDGKYWVFNSYSSWRERDFPFWSEKTIQRTFKKLENDGYIITANYNSLSIDKTKWYTINYKKLDERLEEFYHGEKVKETPEHKGVQPSGQSVQSIETSCPDQYQRLHTEITSESTDKDLRIDNDLPFSKTESNIYTSVPEEAEAQSPDAPEETVIDSVVKDVAADLGIDESENKDIANDIKTIITAYGSLSADKPRNITKSGLSKIIYSYLMPPENMDDATADDYVEMIRLYFKTDFNARKRYKGKITRSLEHFMSDGIRSLLYERVRRNDST